MLSTSQANWSGSSLTPRKYYRIFFVRCVASVAFLVLREKERTGRPHRRKRRGGSRRSPRKAGYCSGNERIKNSLIALGLLLIGGGRFYCFHNEQIKNERHRLNVRIKRQRKFKPVSLFIMKNTKVGCRTLHKHRNSTPHSNIKNMHIPLYFPDFMEIKKQIRKRAIHNVRKKIERFKE